MRRFKTLMGVLAIAPLLAAGQMAVFAPEAMAQAQCRQKCIDEEQACLARTGNKGQCGGKAGQCVAKCK
ncbi:hypothetical protein EDC65_1570 [Stella humosa]|uniref:Uncharacterized protein n=1 Tax=Stella humosa TaxID=94 RepID=A0A3N1M7T4_9PROT|nr:hypothetical protein [Stella humosa]ROP99782.1 hypothetical protein EDC65_1570 [Stella humosa]BBK30991.1 hypothetical protein STHU_16250 [Stella humosa]